VFEEDEHFYVRLSNARFSPTDTLTQMNGAAGQPPKFPEVQLSVPSMATVIILDDDHCGVFNLDKKDIDTVESIGTYDVKVSRWSGARGRVAVPYETEEGTAKPGKDYVHVESELIFENNETEYVQTPQYLVIEIYDPAKWKSLGNDEGFFVWFSISRKYIEIQILEEDSYEKDVLFYLNIKEPRLLEGKSQLFFILDIKYFTSIIRQAYVFIPLLQSSPFAKDKS